MTVIYRDVKTLVESQTLFGHGAKALVMYDTSTGEATGLDVEVLINLDAEKADTTQVEALDAAMVHKTGNETIAGIKTFSSSPVVPTPTTDMQASTKKYSDDILAAYGVDVNNVCGAVNHYKRVLADSGSVLDRTQLLKVYTEYIRQRTETVRLYIPEVGAKLRTSGLNRYGVKAYDLSTNQKDAVQATDGTQPYMTVGAAPNARLGMRFVQGQTQTGLMDFDDVAFAAGASWTLTKRVKINNKGTGRVYLGAAWIETTATTIVLNSGSVAVLTGTYNFECGRTYTIEFQYANGAGLILVNGQPIVTVPLSGAITFGQVSYSTTYPADRVVYAMHLTNTRKATYQSQLDHTFLSTLFPDMESVTIGNQVWATDNFAGTVAGDGTVIPEVQSAETAADATNIYNSVYAATSGSAAVKDLAATKAAAMWCHYDNSADNGAVYGKLYNWYAVHLFDLYTPVRGWRIPSKADFDQLVANQGGNTVTGAGGKLKAKYGGFDNAFATNESGFSATPGGARLSDGTFTEIGTFCNLVFSDLYRVSISSAAVIFSASSFTDKTLFRSIRLLRNEPAGANELSYTSGLFNTDITSAAKQIPISFGRTVDAIRIKSENALTAIEAKLHNAAGTAVATLITAKTIGAGETKMFTVAADWVSLLQDGTVRVTASGNSGAAVGMEIEVLTHKGVLS